MYKNLELVQIPLAVHESDMEREDRKHKRLWIALMLTIILLVASNAFWIWYESQFVETETTITQEGEADGNGTILLNNGGDLNYGESKTGSDS